MKFPRIITLFTATALTGWAWAQDQEKPPIDGKGKPPIPQRDGPRPPGGPGDQGPHREMPPKFSDVDADQSGDISESEWVGFQVKRTEQRAKDGFGFLDANKDGKLTEAEMPKPRMEGDRGPGGRPEGGPRPPREGDRPGPKPEGDGQVPKRPPVEGDKK